MASIGQIRGVLLEEIVLALLERVGYRIVVAGEEGTAAGSAGLLLQGRGTWHQIDALAALDHGPAFSYPIRLLVEAKCYVRGPVDVGVIRNCVGVLRDVSDNYFVHLGGHGVGVVVVPRYNFLSAVFSTTGYTREAQRYALAHQIFLIQYKDVNNLQDTIRQLSRMQAHDFRSHAFGEEVRLPAGQLSAIRQEVRACLREGRQPRLHDVLNTEGSVKLRTLLELCNDLRGSYYGMIQGRYPVHIVLRHPIPPRLFQNTDGVLCRIYSNNPETWCVEPRVPPDDPGFFTLEFGLPAHVAALVSRVWDDPVQVADAKNAHFSFITLTGSIGGVQRQIRLTLDQNWLYDYLDRVRDRS